MVAATAAHAQSAPPLRVVLLETQSVGVAPVVGRFVDRALARAAADAGLEPLPADQGARALAEMGAAYPPSVADLWRLTYRVHADRGVLAVASAKGGRYVIQVRVACVDGRGPFDAAGTSGREDLESQAAALLNQALQAAAAASPPASPAASASAPASASPPASPPSAPPPPVPAPAPAALGFPRGPYFFAERPPPAAAPPPKWRLAVHNDVALGLAKQAFVNDVLGARVDLRLAPRSAIGAYLGYAMLPGREGRVHSVLTYIQLEQRIPITREALQIPLRLDLGYLARNGGFLRLASGLGVALGKDFELVFDLLAPTFWITPDSSLFSLDFGVELNVTL
jgi:hypothetical protein